MSYEYQAYPKALYQAPGGEARIVESALEHEKAAADGWKTMDELVPPPVAASEPAAESEPAADAAPRRKRRS